MKKFIVTLIMFLFGGTGYAMIEILWRGNTHWSMFLLGGLCFVVIDSISTRAGEKMCIWQLCLFCSFAVTVLEFITGCIVNLLLGWDIWDYSNLPLNLMGQVCVTFMALWFLLCIPVSQVARRMSRYLCTVVGTESESPPKGEQLET